jgi:gluconokinase
MYKKILVMGVSGSGKTRIGEELAERLGLDFFDGDDYHSAGNVKKMACGIPLTDEDRFGWLKTLNQLVKSNSGLVIACSALTTAYRELLIDGNPELKVIYLKGSFRTIWSRLNKRTDHYFHGEQMLVSQFNTLVEPSASEAIIVDIEQSAKQVVNEILETVAKDAAEQP